MKLLVIRLSSIGDIILTTPVISEIKKKNPYAEIDFLLMKSFKESISGNENISKLILFDKEKYKGLFGIKRFVKEEMKDKEYDLIIDLHSKMRSKWISRFLKVKTYRYSKRKWWKTILVKLNLIKYTVDNTIVKNYFGAVKNLGIEYKGENLDFNFSEKDIEKIAEHKDYVVFAPGASKETKKWCKEYFADLAIMIKEKYNKKVILIGSNGEKEDLDKINTLSGNICINEAGKYSLKESGALMSRALFVVSNDSGPFHIARGVKTLCFVIFGPTSPKMFSYDKNSILLYADEVCSPCSLHGDKICPKGHFNCMKNLKAENVFEIIEKRIAK